MFVATNRLKVKKDHGHELEERFLSRGGVEQQPGFLGFELWKLDREEDVEDFLVVTHWESKEAHDHWTHSEAFRQAHSGARADFLAGPGEFNSYDVRITSRPEQPKNTV